MAVYAHIYMRGLEREETHSTKILPRWLILDPCGMILTGLLRAKTIKEGLDRPHTLLRMLQISWPNTKNHHQSLCTVDGLPLWAAFSDGGSALSGSLKSTYCSLLAIKPKPLSISSRKKLHDPADKMMYFMNNKFLKGFSPRYLLDNHNL